MTILDGVYHIAPSILHLKKKRGGESCWWCVISTICTNCGLCAHKKTKRRKVQKKKKKNTKQERSWSTHVREVERDVRLRPLEVLVAHNFSKIKPYLYSPQAQIAFGLISDYVGPLSTFGHPFSSLPCSWEHHTHR